MRIRINLKESALLADESFSSIAHYRKMYDRISALGRIGVWECDVATRHLTWTDAIYDLFEMKRGTPVEQQKITAMYEPESRALLERYRIEARHDCVSYTMDAHIRTARGNKRWIRVTVDYEKEDGRPIKVFGTMQDISSERATLEKVHLLQAELIHVSRVNAMSAMASTLAHELNQPLTAVSNYLVAAKRMATAQPIGGDLSSCIAGAEASAQRAGEIIRRLREMTVRRQTRREAFEVKAAVDEAVALASAGRPELEVARDVDPGARLVGDRIQFQQVLLNLIQNSYEAAGGSPCRIEINVCQLPGELQICVTDRGPGIDPVLLPRVFESLVTTKDQGMGIGLSVSRTIVENHGGRITACNEPGGGVTICFILPLGGDDAKEMESLGKPEAGPISG